MLSKVFIIGFFGLSSLYLKASPPDSQYRMSEIEMFEGQTLTNAKSLILERKTFGGTLEEYNKKYGQQELDIWNEKSPYSAYNLLDAAKTKFELAIALDTIAREYSRDTSTERIKNLQVEIRPVINYAYHKVLMFTERSVESPEKWIYKRDSDDLRTTSYFIQTSKPSPEERISRARVSFAFLKMLIAFASSQKPEVLETNFHYTRSMHWIINENISLPEYVQKSQFEQKRLEGLYVLEYLFTHSRWALGDVPISFTQKFEIVRMLPNLQVVFLNDNELSKPDSSALIYKIYGLVAESILYSYPTTRSTPQQNDQILTEILSQNLAKDSKGNYKMDPFLDLVYRKSVLERLAEPKRSYYQAKFWWNKKRRK